MMNRKQTLDRILELYGEAAVVTHHKTTTEENCGKALVVQKKLKAELREMIDEMMQDAYKVGWAKCKEEIIDLLKKEAEDRENKEKKLWK